MKIPIVRQKIMETCMLVEIKDNVWEKFIKICKEQEEDPSEVLSFLAQAHVAAYMISKNAKKISR